jgi:hypothetical protein
VRLPAGWQASCADTFSPASLPVAAAVAFATAPSAAGAASAVSAPGGPGVLSAPAAVTPGWRIVQFLPSVVGVGLSVSGRRDAWLAGDVCGADSLCDHVIVRHWDGTAWRTVPLPKAVTATAAEAGIGAVTASSASNAWVFDLRSTESVDYGTTALHWTGRGWAPLVRLAADINAGPWRPARGRRPGRPRPRGTRESGSAPATRGTPAR